MDPNVYKEVRNRRGKRGGRKVKAREQKRREWIRFSDKVEILQRDCDDLLIDILIWKLEHAISDRLVNEKCDIKNSSFSCKFGKPMHEHQAETYGISPIKSAIDDSVNVSSLELDLTKEIDAAPESQEEAKVHDSMDGKQAATPATAPAAPTLAPAAPAAAQSAPAVAPTPTARSNKKQVQKHSNKGKPGQQQRHQQPPPPATPPAAPAASTAPPAAAPPLAPTMAPPMASSTPTTAPLVPAPLTTSTSQQLQHQLPMAPLPPIGMLPSVQMPGVPMPGFNPMMNWGGINVAAHCGTLKKGVAPLNMVSAR